MWSLSPSNLISPDIPSDILNDISRSHDCIKLVGIPVFGPSQSAARMEGSKTFSKDFMKRHNIPTASYENFSDFQKAKAYLESVSHRVVLKVFFPFSFSFLYATHSINLV